MGKGFGVFHPKNKDRYKDVIIKYCIDHNLHDSNYIAITITSSPTHKYKDWEQQKEYLTNTIQQSNINQIASLEFDTKQRGWHYHTITHISNIDEVMELLNNSNLNIDIQIGYDLTGWINYITKECYNIVTSSITSSNTKQNKIGTYLYVMTTNVNELPITNIKSVTAMLSKATTKAMQSIYKATKRYLYAKPPT